MSRKKSSDWYTKQLSHPKWKEKRQVILERDNHECQLCGLKKELQIHHGYYTKRTNLWEYPDDSLITLCSLCHEITDNYKHDIHLMVSRIHPSLYEHLFLELRNLKQMADEGKLDDISDEVKEFRVKFRDRHAKN